MTMIQNQIAFYECKLAYEMDPSDLFHALEEKEDVIAIDTRKALGFEKEHIPTAIHLPHGMMTVENTKHLDKDKTYVCYCDGIGCNGSTRGALKLSRLGFKVKELIGGLEWWKYDGYATEGKSPSKGATIGCAC